MSFYILFLHSFFIRILQRTQQLLFATALFFNIFFFFAFIS